MASSTSSTPWLPPGGANAGDKVIVILDLGAGSITGGPLRASEVSPASGSIWRAPCSSLLVPMCANEWPLISYDLGIRRSRATARGGRRRRGRGPRTTPGGGATTDVVFTAAPKVIIAADTPLPRHLLLAVHRDDAGAVEKPAGFIEQVVSYDMAQCDKCELDSGGFQTGEPQVADSSSTSTATRPIQPTVGAAYANRPVRDVHERDGGQLPAYLCAGEEADAPLTSIAGNRTSGRRCDQSKRQEEGKGCGGKQPSVQIFQVDVTKVAGKAALMVPSFKTVSRIPRRPGHEPDRPLPVP